MANIISQLGIAPTFGCLDLTKVKVRETVVIQPFTEGASCAASGACDLSEYYLGEMEGCYDGGDYHVSSRRLSRGEAQAIANNTGLPVLFATGEGTLMLRPN